MKGISISDSDTEQVVGFTKDLVRIPSVNPPGEETKVAEYFSAKLSQLGFKVDLYEVDKNRCNIVGTLKGKGGGRTLMFNGHMDVVPPGDPSLWKSPPFEGAISSDKVYGRGSVDMKGGMAAMLAAIKSLVDNSFEFRGTLVFAGVVDEEVASKGTKSIIDKGYAADMAIVGEPTELKVKIAHKGMLMLEVTTTGQSVHASTVRSSNPRVGVNAIYKMAKAVSEFEKHLLVLEKKENHLVGNPTISVGTISGGTKSNVVPERCTVVLERRIVPGEKIDDVRFEVEAILAKIGNNDPDFRYATRVLVTHEPAKVDADQQIVKICRDAVRQVTGSDLGATGAPFGTDMYLLVKKGIPTVILGPGNIQQAHNANEFIEIQQLKDAVRIYAKVITDVVS